VSDPPANPAVLFTAFEPSGDDHASGVIRELRRRRPDLPIYAWGGPKMRRAGAEIIAETGDDAVVGVPGWDKIRQHQQINRDIDHWLAEHEDVRVHVPVDSPAANFPICKIAKRHGRNVVHLVAPQIWAWGGWRIAKLRRRTDLVLCLFPFEETWFRDRRVPARFIGHPLFDDPLDMDALTERAREMEQGEPRLAIMPGSRPAELRRNFPVLLNTFKAIRRTHPGARGMIAATTEAVREHLYQRANVLGGWPEGLDVVVGETDLVVRWADLALVVSGTVTLQLAKQATPMIIIYKVNELSFRTLGAVLINTPYFTLPNLIAQQEIVPELIPFFKDTGQLTAMAEQLLGSPDRMEAQRLNLRSITAKFAGKLASAGAADAIEEWAGLREPHPDSDDTRRAPRPGQPATQPAPAPRR
jgi:lipid-A-disaccharide synthase